ncbi:17-beta-hydroxysteroid dehydrogenase type 3 isoform X2 [Oncorhynchus kisutch]|uniref:17-beta-hydroxysteroid dehydrogenase type 3 isoform X2 n=1 Tax=Oncorhynchus kisutch TaxID=8019 RepID=UPI0009A01735|nr:testosterone 17-beta-dehydrogenase 3 isoform X2 [Oncorhynchus kisutch]
MDLMELFFVCLGAAVVVFYGVKMVRFAKMLYPRVCFPQPDSFFTSMGEWAVVTGGSDGIGKAYAFELAGRGLNVVILSRTKDKLDRVALEIENYKSDQLQCESLGQDVPNSPARDGEEVFLERGKGVIVNISSGVASVPSPMYTMYCASKVFVERFSQGLQAEYKAKRVMIQAVAPFGVSTPMTGYQKSNMVTLTAEDFVRTSLEYLQAGDKTYGSICHTVLGWMVQAVPQQILHSETMQDSLLEYVKKRVGT